VIPLFVNPTQMGSSRLTTAAEMFSLFRFRSIRMQIPSSSSAAAIDYVFSYTTITDVNPPTTLDQAQELDYVSPVCGIVNDGLINQVQYQVPMMFNLSRSELLSKGPTKWWQCNISSTGGANTFSVHAAQGVIYCSTNSSFTTASVTGTMWYECEFCDAGGSSAVPRQKVHFSTPGESEESRHGEQDEKVELRAPDLSLIPKNLLLVELLKRDARKSSSSD